MMSTIVILGDGAARSRGRGRRCRTRATMPASSAARPTAGHDPATFDGGRRRRRGLAPRRGRRQPRGRARRRRAAGSSSPPPAGSRTGAAVEALAAGARRGRGRRRQLQPRRRPVRSAGRGRGRAVRTARGVRSVPRRVAPGRQARPAVGHRAGPRPPDRRPAIRGLDTADDLEVVSIRAGASPGMHLVGFDAAGETVELRLTARDRSAYAVGILAAADWLTRRPGAGHPPFDPVVDALLARPEVAA